MEPSSRSVVANGLRHHVLEWDGGGRTTVLCLHGFLDLAWAFHRVAPRLAQAGFHVLAPDLRGSVAAYLAGALPERVWRAVIMEGIRIPEVAPESMPKRVEEWIHGVRRARRHRQNVYRTLEDAAARIRLHDPLCPEDEARFIAEHGTRRVDGGHVYLHDPLHLTRAPYAFRTDHGRAFWHAIQCPVLLLDGSESERVPIDYPQRLAAFRDARLAVIPGAGHMMMRHQPEAVARAVLEFLAE